MNFNELAGYQTSLGNMTDLYYNGASTMSKAAYETADIVVEKVAIPAIQYFGSTIYNNYNIFALSATAILINSLKNDYRVYTHWKVKWDVMPGYPSETEVIKMIFCPTLKFACLFLCSTERFINLWGLKVLDATGKAILKYAMEKG